MTPADQFFPKAPSVWAGVLASPRFLYATALALVVYAFLVAWLIFPGQPVDPLTALGVIPIISLNFGVPWGMVIASQPLRRLGIWLLALPTLAILAIVHFYPHHPLAQPLFIWPCATMLALLSVAVITFNQKLSRRFELGNSFHIRLAQTTFMTAIMLITPTLLVFTTLQPLLIDMHIMAFQNRLGLAGFEAALYDWYQKLPLLAGLPFSLPYVLIPAAVMIMGQALERRLANVFLGCWVLMLVVGYSIYLMLPAMCHLSLQRVYPGFSFSGPGPEGVIYLFDNSEAHNAIPSLHAAWALLLIIFAPALRWPWAMLAIVFGLCNILATLVLGMHWLMDLFLSPPLLAIALYLAQRMSGQTVNSSISRGILFSTIGFIAFIVLVATQPDRLYLHAEPMAAGLLVMSAVSTYLAVRLAAASIRNSP